MLNQRGQRLKIIAAAFSMVACLGFLAPSAYAADASLVMPVRGKLIQGYHQGHYAYDIREGSSPDVISAGAGTVIKVSVSCGDDSYGCGGGYGNFVIIDHGSGIQSMYAHLGVVAVQEGDVVNSGEVIGKIGRSGNVESDRETHLHFEVRANGMKMPPVYYMKGF